MQSKKLGKVRAALVELFTRSIEFEKNEKIYQNGLDNLYPYEIERVINNSPTAALASKAMSKFIAGSGVSGDYVIDRKNGKYLSEVVEDIADDISTQGGSFVWIGYGVNSSGEVAVTRVESLRYADCRISKEDDNDYPGIIVVDSWDCKKKGFGRDKKKGDKEWFYPFNPNPEAVISQMRKDAGNAEATPEELISSYRGQVMYINTTPKFKYALSPFDSAYNDMDSEFRFSLYTNTQFRTGFVGKTAVIFQGLDEEQEKEERKNVGEWLGAENTGQAYVMNVDSTADIDKVLNIVQVKAQFDDKLFAENEKRIRRNILGCANNLPEVLVYSGDGALFGANGETYETLRDIYSENTSSERALIEKTFKRMGIDLRIIPLTETAQP